MGDPAGKMKQFATWFTHGVPGGAKLRAAIYQARTGAAVLAEVERFFTAKAEAGESWRWKPTGRCRAIRKARWSAIRASGTAFTRFAVYGSGIGKRMVARAPSPSSRLTSWISPPWARAICWASARPTPLPEGLVV